MASIQKKGNSWYCQFYWEGRRSTFSIGRVSAPQAEAKATRAAEVVELLERGMLRLPDGMDVVAFVKHDGRPPASAGAREGRGDAREVARRLTLVGLRDRFLAAREGGREESTLKTGRIHFKHLVATLGEDFPLADLAQSDLQGHVGRRARLGISATTIRKEVTTLRTAWHWAVDTGELARDYPNKGLIYPKEDKLPPYQTREEIERQVAAGDLTPGQVDALWDALYLRPGEIAELLGYARDHARHAWIHPLFCMAAHTGARRSELLAMKVADVDFEGGGVTIREKKRVKGKRSTRRAPMTPLLAEALKGWLAEHPGGQVLFCHAAEVAGSKKRGRTTGHRGGVGRPTTLVGRMATVEARGQAPPGPLTFSECHAHFKKTLEGSRWGVV